MLPSEKKENLFKFKEFIQKLMEDYQNKNLLELNYTKKKELLILLSNSNFLAEIKKENLDLSDQEKSFTDELRSLICANSMRKQKVLFADEIDDLGNTELHNACLNNDMPKIIELIKSKKVDPRISNIAGLTAADIIKKNPSLYEKILSYLLSKDCCQGYGNIDNNIIALSVHFQESFYNSIEVKEGICHGMTFLWGMDWLTKNDGDSENRINFLDTLEVLSRDYEKYPLKLKNSKGEIVVCTSLDQVLKTFNNEIKLYLRAFLNELLLSHSPENTSLTEVMPMLLDGQDMVKSSEFLTKIKLVISMPYIGTKKDYEIYINNLIGQLKSMPVKFFIGIDTEEHSMGATLDKDRKELLFFDINFIDSNNNCVMSYPVDSSNSLFVEILFNSSFEGWPWSEKYVKTIFNVYICDQETEDQKSKIKNQLMRLQRISGVIIKIMQ